MRTVVVIQNTTLADNYGLSSYLRNLAKNLATKKDLRVHLICSSGPSNSSVCPPEIVLHEVSTSTYSPIDNLKFTAQAYQILKKIQRMGGVEIIHCLYPNSSVLAAVLFKLTKSKKITIVYDLRSPWLHIAIERGSIPKLLGKPLLVAGYASEFFLSIFVDKFIFITEGLRNHYERRLWRRGKPYILIPSGIDISEFTQPSSRNVRRGLGVAQDAEIVGYVGVLSSMRQLTSVIDAFAASKNSKAVLVLIGDGDALSDLREYVKNHGLEERVKLPGRIPYAEVHNYIDQFSSGICHLPDTFVFRRSYPMKILEYLAAGKPVLASKLLAHEEIAKAFPENVFIYNGKHELTKYIDNLPSMRAKQAGEIRNYDWSVLIDQVAKYY